MERPSNQVRISEEDASAGRKTSYMRSVLGLGMLLAVIALFMVGVIPSL